MSSERPHPVVRLPAGSLDFTVEWLDYEGKVFAKDTVSKRDLTDAIRWAAERMRQGTGNAADAHGLFVRLTSAESTR